MPYRYEKIDGFVEEIEKCDECSKEYVSKDGHDCEAIEHQAYTDLKRILKDIINEYETVGECNDLIARAKGMIDE